MIEVVIGRAQGLLHAWQHARKNSCEQVQRQHQVQPITWQPPTGFVKCNIDVAIFASDKIVSMGACVRDERGTLISAM